MYFYPTILITFPLPSLVILSYFTPGELCPLVARTTIKGSRRAPPIPPPPTPPPRFVPFGLFFPPSSPCPVCLFHLLKLKVTTTSRWPVLQQHCPASPTVDRHVAVTPTCPPSYPPPTQPHQAGRQVGI